MQYTLTMSTRMLAIAGLCAFLLCVLLFLLGMELGKRFADPLPPAPGLAASASPAAPATPASPATPEAPAATAAKP
jgi:hypothetical protein